MLLPPLTQPDTVPPRARPSVAGGLVVLLRALVANVKLLANQRRKDKPAAEQWCDRYLDSRDLLRRSMMEFLEHHDAFRPHVGRVNEMRKRISSGISDRRHELNQVPAVEPDADQYDRLKAIVRPNG